MGQLPGGDVRLGDLHVLVREGRDVLRRPQRVQRREGVGPRDEGGRVRERDVPFGHGLVRRVGGLEQKCEEGLAPSWAHAGQEEPHELHVPRLVRQQHRLLEDVEQGRHEAVLGTAGGRIERRGRFDVLLQELEAEDHHGIQDVRHVLHLQPNFLLLFGDRRRQDRRARLRGAGAMHLVVVRKVPLHPMDLRVDLYHAADEHPHQVL
mmetsp:Transcript_67689/g.198779  ORF Transcript_67689/g.198779 Transcript_67689/m.198779 type:complete len:207 (-) Transcript_67689:817-1437(-)